jgi:pimeloyl-ACP methyl ester carboxylesterase
VPSLRSARLNSLLLVHGAANGPWVFDGWADSFPDVDLYAVDLHAGLDIAQASMANYEAAVTCAAELLVRPLAVCGWSMGGLAAMMAARRVEPDGLVLIEPSPPAEVQGLDKSSVPEPGTFDGEQTYGPFPDTIAARPESVLARAERKRGISVPSLPAPALVVSGREFAEERGAALARVYGADEARFGEASHWDLVLDPAIRRAIAKWLRLQA